MKPGPSEFSGDKSEGGHWREIFEEHPEFFRLDRERKMASLVWRRQYPKRYHVDREVRLSVEEVGALSPDEITRIARDPLSPSDIKTLIDAAVSLHARAIEMQRERRWWIPLFSSIGGLLGAIVGALLSALLKK